MRKKKNKLFSRYSKCTVIKEWKEWGRGEGRKYFPTNPAEYQRLTLPSTRIHMMPHHKMVGHCLSPKQLSLYHKLSYFIWNMERSVLWDTQGGERDRTLTATICTSFRRWTLSRADFGKTITQPTTGKVATLIPYSDEKSFGYIAGVDCHASSPPSSRAMSCPGVCQPAPKPRLGTRKHWARGCRWIWSWVASPSQVFSGLDPPPGGDALSDSLRNTKMFP